MSSIVCEARPIVPSVNINEVYRYALCRGEADEQTKRSLLTVANELLPLLTYSATYLEVDIDTSGVAMDFGLFKTESRSLMSALEGCQRAVIFLATVGLGPERMIKKYEIKSPSLALLANALGTERVEALCDALCAELALKYSAEGYTLTHRFSPGYGDLPLELQRSIVSALGKPLGLRLSESLLMSPQKSVSAIMGLKK